VILHGYEQWCGATLQELSHAALDRQRWAAIVTMASDTNRRWAHSCRWWWWWGYGIWTCLWFLSHCSFFSSFSYWPFSTFLSTRKWQFSKQTYVLPQVLFLFTSPKYLRAASADRDEILHHDRKDVVFYNTDPKIWGFSPNKF